MRRIEHASPRRLSSAWLDIAEKPLFFRESQEERVSLLSLRIGR
jgi:hypothetical protein